MILDVMLDRLYRSLVNGPCLNARPHRSRQRLDLTTLAAFSTPLSGKVLEGLLGMDAIAEVPARVPVFRMPEPAPRELTAEMKESEFKQKHADLQEAAKELQGKMVELKNGYPSVAAVGSGRDANQKLGLGGFVHWGNDGFCVDVALNHPEKPLHVTAGLLCDFNRYGKAADPVDWEAFRHFILEHVTKWKLCRVWSPSAFRDIQAHRHQILRKHQDCMASIGDGPAG